jgi:type II secretory pathway pseudopilin PulG
MKPLKTKINSGQTLVEVLIGVAIFSLILSPFLSSLLNLTTANVKYRQQTQATHHARELLEIAYSLSVNADSWTDDFAALADDPTQPYYPVQESGIYSLFSLEKDTQTVGRFERAFYFQKARRDEEGNLTEDPTAPEDLNTIRVTSKVTWGQNQEIELVTYLIDLGAF